jgi:hypothetical protein
MLPFAHPWRSCPERYTKIIVAKVKVIPRVARDLLKSSSVPAFGVPRGSRDDVIYRSIENLQIIKLTY